MAEIQVDVRRSVIWQMTSTVIRSGGSCLVVDPGYFPREIADLAQFIPKRLKVEALLFTHSHWDHVVGHGIFPGVPVYTSSVLARSILEEGELATEAMRKAKEYDSQWYVDRPWGYGWPEEVRGLDDGGWFNIGDLDIEAFLIPGHAPDGMAIRAENWLFVGDYLSPCEIPFVDNLTDYRRALKRLITLIGSGIDNVIPGHGPPIEVTAELVGDLLAVTSAGAYGMAMGSNYNTRPRAAEVMVDGRQAFCVRQRERIVDLIAGESTLP